MPQLLRKLGTRDAALIVMGGIVGSRIFVNPSRVAKMVHTAPLIMLAWCIGDKKKNPPEGGFFYVRLRLLAVAGFARETIAAVHRLVAARLERNFGYAAALAARGLEHFARASAAAAHAVAAGAAALRTHRFARLTAIGTTVGLVLKTFGCIKLLFAGGKGKLTAAIDAIQLFINVH